MNRGKSRALVIFSGGQDSTTCLYWAAKNFESVEAITFVYGQRHEVELRCAEKICQAENIPWSLVDLSFVSSLNSNALVNQSEEIVERGPYQNLPSTFVPGRNVFFLSVAAAYAAPRGIRDLVLGVCQTDYSGYPDCRKEFIDSMEQSLSLALDHEMNLHTPLMDLTKAETFEKADQLGALNQVLEGSHTCYRGERTRLNEWGYGCGECPACVLRKKGFQEWKQSRLLTD